MDKKPNLDRRRARPHTLGGAFGVLLRAFGRHTSDADLATRWAEIIGPELAEQIQFVSISKIGGTTAGDKLKKRTLTVRATVPAMATLLNYRRGDIISRVNEYFGYDAIGTVRIK